ncbi:MAG: serine/threonine-protein kinase, partial [Myxococcota bacterium]
MSDTSQKIREWTLHEVVGRGGMGVVYRATHDLEPGRDFAIKVVAPHLVADENVRARFLREIQTARELKHPNIVEAETAFEEDGQLYLPMAFLDGVTLDRVLAERDGVPMPEHEALAIFRQAAAGLAHAHERGFLHRDIKPANIHVDRDGRVRLLDFGLARRGEGTHLTR